MRVTASVLNVRSGPGTNFRILGKLNRNDKVEALETNGNWSWVKPGDGWVSRDYLASPTHIVTPEGSGGIISLFGPAASPACSAGRVELPRPLKLGWSSASVSRFACHVEIATLMSEVFHEIFRRGLWGNIDTFDGCYNARKIGSSGKWSTHAWGIAVDLNASTNRQGSTSNMSPEIVKVFEEAGFVWGGRFSGRSIDPMHFQFARGY